MSSDGRRASLTLALTLLTRGALTWFGLLWAMGGSCFSAEPGPAPAAPHLGSPEKTSRLFASLIPRVEITLKPEAVQSLRENPREYVRATLREGADVFENVAIKLKGSRGSFRPVDDYPALTINMDKFQEGRSFHGLDKFHLNNSVQDPTLLDEIICGELFRSAGVPAARATQAHVKFNGRDLGYYVLKEGFEKRFLKRNFKNNTGNLYDGGFLMDVDEGLEKDSGNGPNDWSDLIALTEAANEPDLAKRKERLSGILDMDRFITFAALEMLTCDWDGYVQNRNNYRLYHDPTTRKFVFIPHGMDQMFWDPNYPITPGGSSAGRGRFRGRRFRRSGLVAERAFEVFAFQRQYLDRLGQLLNKEFTVESLTAQVDRIEARIRAQAGRSDPQFVSYMSANARNLRRQLAGRVRSAKAQYEVLTKRFRK